MKQYLHVLYKDSIHLSTAGIRKESTSLSLYQLSTVVVMKLQLLPDHLKSIYVIA